jgi:hypothetical protein
MKCPPMNFPITNHLVVLMAIVYMSIINTSYQSLVESSWNVRLICEGLGASFLRKTLLALSLFKVGMAYGCNDERS